MSAAVFAVWTLIALISGLARLALAQALGQPLGVVQAFRHPLIEQWTWAALTPLVFALAARVPLARPHLLRAMAVHAVGFVLLSFVHCAIAQALAPMRVPPGYHGPAVLLRMLGEVYSDLWMYWPLVGIRALMDAQARARERERLAHRLQQSMGDLQLSLLRAQIQPHFLFNTLHGISALLKVDPRAAEDMVSDLAEILRASFADASGQEVPLEHEAAIVQCYLRIQQRRLGERLRIDWRVDDALAQAAVPALVLQSLIENAVVHGIAPVARPCTLTVQAWRDAGQLHLSVRDDGAGMPAEPRSGVGLHNARERLAQLYGSEQRFELDSTPGRGTAVHLTLPYKLADTPDDDDTHPDRGRRALGPAQSAIAA